MNVLDKFQREILEGFLRLDNSETEYGNFHSVGLHLVFKKTDNGLTILTDNQGDEIHILIQTASDFRRNRLEGFGFVHEPTKDDILNELIGKKLISSERLVFEKTELQGEDFVVNRGEVQAIRLGFGNSELVVKASGDEIWTESGARIEIDKTEYPGATWKTN